MVWERVSYLTIIRSWENVDSSFHCHSLCTTYILYVSDLNKKTLMISWVIWKPYRSRFDQWKKCPGRAYIWTTKSLFIYLLIHYSISLWRVFPSRRVLFSFCEYTILISFLSDVDLNDTVWCGSGIQVRTVAATFIDSDEQGRACSCRSGCGSHTFTLYRPPDLPVSP